MSIDLQTLLVRHERRVRLFFTNTLAAGAFSTLTYYTVSCQDGSGPDPNVVAAYAVTGNPVCVELALDQDLVDGGLYLFSAIGVPAIDASVTPNTATQPARVALGQKVANVEPAATSDDRDALMYQRDLVWDGTDLVEDASGDLATVTGQTNVVNAIVRREMGEPLAWDADYSPRARDYVNAPNVTLDELRVAVVRQARLDPRIVQARATVAAPLDAAGENPVLSITITPIGGKPQTKPVPLPK